MTSEPVVPVLYETHMHTSLCRHAVGDPEEYAEVAQRRGLKGIIVTDHNPVENWTARSRMTLQELPDYVEMVQRARDAWAGEIDVRLGLESDFFPGIESYLEKLHQMHPFNYILGSVHPQISDYQTLYMKPEPADYQRLYFEHLAMAAETRLFDCLAHPDLVKNVHPRRWNPELIMDAIKSSLDRIAKTGVAMELNTSGVNKDVPEMNPGRRILEEIHARKIPVVVGADAHKPERVSDGFERALSLLSDIGFTHVSLFLERRRSEIRITDALPSLRPLLAPNVNA